MSLANTGSLYISFKKLLYFTKNLSKNYCLDAHRTLTDSFSKSSCAQSNTGNTVIKSLLKQYNLSSSMHLRASWCEFITHSVAGSMSSLFSLFHHLHTL
ncbi:hypothetical protein ACF0H5_009303 [Mactra antiquata]